MQAPPPAAALQLSAAQRVALRDNLGAAIYNATRDAKAEAEAWRARALAAEADTQRLREGLLTDLALERAPSDLPAALHAVAGACRPLAAPSGGSASAAELAAQDECHARFLRQGARCVQRSLLACGCCASPSMSAQTRVRGWGARSAHRAGCERAQRRRTRRRGAGCGRRSGRAGARAAAGRGVLRG
jgi:hypothetical protein